MVTEEDLKQLPLCAIVAFAARCARRVQPLYRLPENFPDRAKHLRAVETAISTAELFARERKPIAAYVEVDAAAYAAGTDNAAAQTYPAACAAGGAAADAYGAASAAARAAVDGTYTRAVVSAAGDANAAAARAAAYDDAEIDASTLDLATLKRLELGSFPELGRPIDPGEGGPLGPLWPNGAPEWFDVRPAKPAPFTFTQEPVSAGATPPEEALIQDVHPSLTIVWDPDVLNAEEYADLVIAVGDLARIDGGLGIQRVRSRGFGIPCGERVPQ